MGKEKLVSYRNKRDFNKTTEPYGVDFVDSCDDTYYSFVIHEHHASTLHYDFRLEIDGVLKSWVVPKGITADLRVKRLAIPTEDHPLEYKNFSGLIPKGEYGAGEVIIWDAGKYRNLREISMQQSWQQGKIEIELYGNKITGRYALIRMQYDKVAKTTSTIVVKRPNKQNKPQPWLLVRIVRK